MYKYATITVPILRSNIMKNASVIGAGIIGLATALSLQESGREVTLIDRLSPGEGTSSGNAGIISTGSVHPESLPGIWKEIPNMTLNSLAPLRLRPAYFWRSLPWLLRFLRNANERTAERASIAISALSKPALEYYAPLLERAGAEQLVQQHGTLYVYETAAQFAQAKKDCSYRDRRGINYRLLDSAALHELEPSLKAGLAGGILTPDSAHTVSPIGLSKKFFALFQRRGGRFIQSEVDGFDIEKDRVVAIRSEQKVQTDEVFVTAGAYSGSLARQLGSVVPLDTERGYHLMLPDSGIQLHHNIIFPARGFAATSMEDGLRLAGTVEFAGLKAAPDYSRARRLAKSAAAVLPNVQTDNGKPWMGFRPSVPDSIPVISASPHFQNAYFGFGHGHLGLTQAAITGAILVALANGEEPPVASEPYRIDRSW
jgi:D-amino-acid dehydrogenase